MQRVVIQKLDQLLACVVVLHVGQCLHDFLGEVNPVPENSPSVKFGLNVLLMEISMYTQEGKNAILFPQSVFPETYM